MQNVSYFVTAASIVVLLAASGLGPALLLFPRELEKYRLPLLPALGFSWITLLGWMFFQSDAPGTDSYAILLVTISLGLGGVGVIVKRKSLFRRSPQVRRTVRGVWIPLGLSLTAFLVLSIPHLKNGLAFSAVSTGNNDLPNYAVISRYLKEFKRTDATSGYLYQDAILDSSPSPEVKFSSLHSLARIENFGAYFTTAYLSTVLHRDPDECLALLPSLFFCLILPLVYLLCIDIFSYGKRGAAVTSLFFGVNSIGHYLIFAGFLAQIESSFLATAFILPFLSLLTFHEEKKISELLKSLPILSLLAWGLFISYAHMMPLVFLLMMGLVLVLSIRKKNFRLAFNWCALLLFVALACAALSPFRLHALSVMLPFMGKTGSGWFLPLLSPSLYLGFDYVLDFQSGLKATYLIRAFCFVFVLSLLALFLRSKLREKSDLFSAYFIGALSLSYFILIQTPDGHSPWSVGLESFSDLSTLGGYRSFKLLAYFLPLLIPCCFLLLRDFKRLKTPGVLLFILTVALIPLNLTKAAQTLEFAKNRSPHLIFVPSEMRNLLKTDRDPKIRSVNIMAENAYWETLWENYFLIHKRLYFNSVSYRNLSSLDGDWDVDMKGAPFFERSLKGRIDFDLVKGRISSFEPLLITDENSSYRVHRRYTVQQSEDVKAGLAKGCDKSGDVVMMKADSDACELEVRVPESGYQAKLRFLVSTGASDQGLEVKLDGRTLLRCTVPYCPSDTFPLQRGENKIQFRRFRTEGSSDPIRFELLDLTIWSPTH
jgi:hypothetical protein